MPSFRPRISSSQMVVRHVPRRQAIWMFFYRMIGKETASKNLEAHWRRKWGLTVNPCSPNWLFIYLFIFIFATHKQHYKELINRRKEEESQLQIIKAGEDAMFSALKQPLLFVFWHWNLRSDHDISPFQDVWGSALRLRDLCTKGKVMRHTENCWCVHTDAFSHTTAVAPLLIWPAELHTARGSQIFVTLIPSDGILL